MTHILDEAAAMFDNGNYSGQTVKKMLRELKEKNPGERPADDVLDKLEQWCNQRWFEVESDEGETFSVIHVGDIIAKIADLRKGGRE